MSEPNDALRPAQGSSVQGAVAEVRDLTISYQADTQQVTVVDGVSFTLERAAPWGWSANPAAASRP